MAIVSGGDIRVIERGDRTEIRVKIDGRERVLLLDRMDALNLAKRIADKAFKPPIPHEAAIDEIEDVKLLPYGDRGDAHLAIIADGIGPAVFRISHYWLEALSKLAEAALEHSSGAGRA
jgi:hypothetical protein